MTRLGIAAGLLSATVFGVAAVVQAHAVRRFETTPDTLPGFVIRSVRDGRSMLVVAAYLVGFVPARGGDLAAAALPGPGDGLDVAAR